MKRRFWIVVVVVAVIIPISVFAVFAYDSVNLDRLCAEQGGERDGDVCLIQIAPQPHEHVPEQAEPVNADDVFTMRPNSVEFFYYPNPAKDNDTYRLFMLVRLPEWMGGGANDTSAFRAYSAKALDDACTVKYRPDLGHQRIENPCQGGHYRVVDGALTLGAIHRSSALSALPYLELVAGENGMLYVEPPEWTRTENGVIGHGRDISLQEIGANSQFMVDAFAEYYPEYPAIPTKFTGYFLAEITPDIHWTTVRYLDFLNKRGSVVITVGEEPRGELLPKLREYNSELWQIGDTSIRIGDSSSEGKYVAASGTRITNVIEFSNEFSYKVKGDNLEFIKKEIVANFFPEYTYDDLVLVSSAAK